MDAVATPLHVSPPPMGLALTEAHRALLEFSALQLTRPALGRMPTGDGHGVMILPGFLGGDGYNAPLRKYLNSLGYHSIGWEQGRNLGPRDDLLERVVEHIDHLADFTAGKVTLIGHSLGGIYARELAKEIPQLVRQVISLGSPFGEGRHSGSYPSRLFSAMNPDEEITIDQHLLSEPPPVPTTAVFTKGDGICNWQICYQQGRHKLAQSIQVWGSHSGLTMNPMVWFLLAERLAQAEDGWQPFHSSGWSRLFHPTKS
jgi:pimeloyl-ACP methyl ester carboxylesterase